MSAVHTRTSSHGPGHAVVIGGGISGLAAAHRLLEGGARVTVLEASGRTRRQAARRCDRRCPRRSRRRIDAGQAPGSGGPRARRRARRPAAAARHGHRVAVDPRGAAPDAQGTRHGRPGGPRSACRLRGDLAGRDGADRRGRDAGADRGRRGRRGRRVCRRPARPGGRRPARRTAARRCLRGRRLPHLDARRRPAALRGRPVAALPDRGRTGPPGAHRRHRTNGRAGPDPAGLHGHRRRDRDAA